MHKHGFCFISLPGHYDGIFKPVFDAAATFFDQEATTVRFHFGPTCLALISLCGQQVKNGDRYSESALRIHWKSSDIESYIDCSPEAHQSIKLYYDTMSKIAKALLFLVRTQHVLCFVRRATHMEEIDRQALLLYYFWNGAAFSRGHAPSLRWYAHIQACDRSITDESANCA